MRTPLLVTCLTVAAAAQAPSFPMFESPQTHAVALSPDGTRLFAVNTPDARLSVFDLRDPARPVLIGEVEVGLEPVAVRARSDDEVWVACHLSDAVSVVDVRAMETVATLACSDEPADVVFAADRAFVPCATEREILVFDAATRVRVGTVPVFADEPRAMAALGDAVFVIAARSGNRTTLVPRTHAPPPPAPSNASLPPPPPVGLIVDAEDPRWAAVHGVSLPDFDLFEIDALEFETVRRVRGVGTILLGLAIQPGTGAVWVSNTEARNLVRFESELRGHVVDNRLTRVGPGEVPAVDVFDLNAGIDYRAPASRRDRAVAIAQPAGLAWSPDGRELFVASFGTDRIAVVDPDGAVVDRIELRPGPAAGTAPRDKRGPRALVHHPGHRLLYVLNRLANTIAVVDTAQRAVRRELPVGFDPTPASLRDGRGFLYDAKLSGKGTASCASCHVDATHDGLAWDLGDPAGKMIEIATPGGTVSMHPMKGPMLTQTLQGLADTAPYHWRGDRATLREFDETFDHLLDGSRLAAGDLDALVAFLESVRFPPNPNRLRDGSLSRQPPTRSAFDGFEFFTTQDFGQGFLCVDCHTLPNGTNGSVISGQTIFEPQSFVVPPLNSIYKRTGRQPVGGLRTSGFGVTHDGAYDDVVDLHTRSRFHFYDGSFRQQMFMESFGTGLMPAVGYTLTVDAESAQQPTTIEAWSLLEAIAASGECDVVVRGTVDGAPAGMLFVPRTASYRPDAAAAASISRAELSRLATAGRARFTLMGVVPGEGRRIALDRDGDGVLDADEGLAAYGAATAACPIELRGNSAPERGNGEFAFVAARAPAGAAGALLLGHSRASVVRFGIELLVDPVSATVADLAADRHGVAVRPMPIPAESALAGVTLYVQAVFASPCGAFGLAASGGLELTVQ